MAGEDSHHLDRLQEFPCIKRVLLLKIGLPPDQVRICRISRVYEKSSSSEMSHRIQRENVEHSGDSLSIEIRQSLGFESGSEELVQAVVESKTIKLDCFFHVLPQDSLLQLKLRGEFLTFFCQDAEEPPFEFSLKLVISSVNFRSCFSCSSISDIRMP
jgi:hypothetical protein